MFTMPEWLLPGDHASRPAANAVAVGALYACSDHSLVYQSDGSTWSAWLDASGTGGAGGTEGRSLICPLPGAALDTTASGGGTAGTDGGSTDSGAADSSTDASGD